jgi:hypothetical protein
MAQASQDVAEGGQRLGVPHKSHGCLPFSIPVSNSRQQFLRDQFRNNVQTR